LKIDGQETPLSQAFLGFSTFTVPAGEHSIQLSYLPPGFALGFTLTLFALLLCLTVKILQKQKPNCISSIMDNASLQKASVILVAVLFAAVILLIYVIPLCLSLYNLILI